MCRAVGRLSPPYRLRLLPIPWAGGLGLVWFAYPFRFARAAVPSLAVALARLLARSRTRTSPLPLSSLRVHQTLSTPRARTCAVVASGEQASKQADSRSGGAFCCRSIPAARTMAMQALGRGGRHERSARERTISPPGSRGKEEKRRCLRTGRTTGRAPLQWPVLCGAWISALARSKCLSLLLLLAWRSRRLFFSCPVQARQGRTRGQPLHCTY